MMRAARFVSQLGVHIEPTTYAAMVDMADRLEIVSAERIRDEFSRLLLGRYPRAGLAVLVESGLAAQMLPELPALQLEIDEHHRHKDVFEHSLTVLDQAIDLEDDGPDLTLRLAALLHDIGKPRTRRFELAAVSRSTTTRWWGADDGQTDAGAALPEVRDRDVSRLVELHLRFHGYGTGEWTDSAVRRYVRDAGPLLPWLHKLTRADSTTRNQRRARALQRAYDSLEERIAQLAAEEELAAIRPELDGNEIMQILAILPGRAVGEAYQFLLELRLEQGPMGRDAAEQALRDWWAARPESKGSSLRRTTLFDAAGAPVPEGGHQIQDSEGQETQEGHPLVGAVTATRRAPNTRQMFTPTSYSENTRPKWSSLDASLQGGVPADLGGLGRQSDDHGSEDQRRQRHRDEREGCGDGADQQRHRGPADRAHPPGHGRGDQGGAQGPDGDGCRDHAEATQRRVGVGRRVEVLRRISSSNTVSTPKANRWIRTTTTARQEGLSPASTRKPSANPSRPRRWCRWGDRRSGRVDRVA